MTEPIDSDGFTTERPNSPQNVPQAYKDLSTADLCRIIADVLEVLHNRISDPQERADISAVMLAQALERGSEPFWMQDVRLAQRRLEARRIAARSRDQDVPEAEV